MSRVNELYSTKWLVKKCSCNVNFKILAFSSTLRPLEPFFIFHHWMLDTASILGYKGKFVFKRMFSFQTGRLK